MNFTHSPLRFPVYRPTISDLEKKYVNECLDSNWISSKGDFIEQFEQAFANYTQVPYATTVCNGTVALHLALLAIGIKPGDEVIVPTLTYVASVNMIAHTGAKPIFVDSLASSWQIDPEAIIEKISPRTKAIMVVHLYGHPCDMTPIAQICKKYNLFLIEDCAEAFGTQYEGKHVGSFGDIGTYSFYGNKTITTGEGGMVVSKNKELLSKVYRLKTQGVSFHKQYWHDLLGYNYRMTNICAAIGLAQLSRADEIIHKKREIAQWYKEELEALPLQTHKEIGSSFHSYWMCSIILYEARLRDSLMTYLDQHGIETRPLFIPIHTMPMYACDESFPVAKSLSSSGINLPSYPELSRSDVKEICRSIREFFFMRNKTLEFKINIEDGIKYDQQLFTAKNF
ncbi:MAG: perosamine synthetase [Chlamydiae bacterium CG10_big_fil_rev_8_21_14_0_10_42_34]|nr:MAG: perosamine synthetase [Chlamydiae bacterium CG10_big_fil_rev_8_21_14_0_10_42_34]